MCSGGQRRVWAELTPALCPRLYVRTTLAQGGLGHMAVLFLKAFGATVTVISTSESKRQEALKVLKADHFLISKDPEQLKVRVGGILR